MKHPLSHWIGFGYRFMVPTWYGKHKGLDYMIRTGTPVFASMNGKCYPRTGVQGGKQVWQYSRQKAWRTRYMHLSKFMVLKGQYVKQGELIGYSGGTGAFSTGPHLHLDIRHNMLWVDPEKIFKEDYLKQLDNYMTKEELLKELDKRYSKKDIRVNFDPTDGSVWIVNHNKRYRVGTKADDWTIFASMHAGESISDTERTYEVTQNRKDVL